jgi:cytochrome o ubiquinol oxidase subunit 2
MQRWGCAIYWVWVYTHRLDPYKPIAAEAAPLEIDVVAEDWKWLFIYPEQNIATVNELVFPADRPLSFTSDWKGLPLDLCVTHRF